MKDFSRLSRAELIGLLKESELKITAQAMHQAEHSRERRQARTALRDSEERLRAILDTAVEGIITIDERGIIESVNPAAEKIFGYTAAEFVGRNVSLLMPPPFREAHDAYLVNYLRTGQAKIIGIGREVVGRRKDGTDFPMDLSVSEVRLAGRRLFTGFVRDITERKRLQREILDISHREQQRIGQDLHDGLSQQLAVNVEKMFKIECRFQCDEPILVQNNEAATHLYRIAQEAINNAIKHGKAKKIIITVQPMGDKHGLLVTNDGVPFPDDVRPSRGMGLRIMNYRAGEIGATLQIRSDREKGTTVMCLFDKNL